MSVAGHSGPRLAATSVGLGKVILLGEHAVVYGYPALAAALDRGVTITVTRAARRGLHIVLPAWGVAASAEHDHPVARTLAVVADALEVGRPDLLLAGDAQLPPAAGLGSSAALAVAIARALLAGSGRAADVTTVTRAAGASEAVMHGTASGVDVALAIAGGIGVYRRGSGFEPLRQPTELRVLVAPSGQPRSTAAMVACVAEATGGRASDGRLRMLGALTDEGAGALVAGDLPALGAAMDRAHGVLADLGISTPRLDALCEAARHAGARGSKLTGAGGGGAVLAIAPRDREPAVLAAWRDLGVTGFAATLAAPGGHRPTMTEAITR